MKRRPAVLTLAAIAFGVGFAAGLPYGVSKERSNAPPMPERVSPEFAKETGNPAAPPPPRLDESDPTEYLAWLRANPRAWLGEMEIPSVVRDDLRFQATLLQLLERCPAEVAAWIKQQPAAWTEKMLVEDGMVSFITKSSTEAVTALLPALSGKSRDALVVSLMDQLVATSPQIETVLRAGVLTATEESDLLGKWASYDGAAALDHATQSNADGARLAALAAEAVATAPEKALAVLADVQDPAAVHSALSKISETDPVLALRYLRDHPEISHDDAKILAWDTRLAAGEPLDRENLDSLHAALGERAPVVLAGASANPADGAAIFSKAAEAGQLPDKLSEVSAGILRRVSANYARQDPAAGLTWALDLPLAEWRSTALAAAARGVAEQDPAALADWLNQAPSTSELDPVISRLVSEIPDDARAALAWADRIMSPELRAKAQSDTAGPSAKPSNP